MAVAAGGGGERPTPPDHRNPTHGVARFLYEADPDTPVVDLAAAYERWKASGDSDQATVSRWSE